MSSCKSPCPGPAVQQPDAGGQLSTRNHRPASLGEAPSPAPVRSREPGRLQKRLQHHITYFQSSLFYLFRDRQARTVTCLGSGPFVHAGIVVGNPRWFRFTPETPWRSSTCHLGICQECRISGPTLDLLNQQQ